jgi:hypothetical protein
LRQVIDTLVLSDKNQILEDILFKALPYQVAQAQKYSGQLNEASSTGKETGVSMHFDIVRRLHNLAVILLMNLDKIAIEDWEVLSGTLLKRRTPTNSGI